MIGGATFLATWADSGFLEKGVLSYIYISVRVGFADFISFFSNIP